MRNILIPAYLFFSVALSRAGDPAVIKVTDLNKRIHNGSDTTYVVNFWATWCPPCVAELPEIDAFGVNSKDPKIKVLLVSINYKEDKNSKLVPFLEEHQIRSETCLLDEVNFDYFPRQVDKDWNGDIPATFIINNSTGKSHLWQQKVNTEFLEEQVNNIRTAYKLSVPPVIRIDDLVQRVFNSSDTTYVVNFWATWCVPCVQELPDLERINEQHKNEKIKVILVTLDFPEDLDKKVVPFLEKKGIRSEVMLLDETNANYFIPKIDDRWTGSLPCTVIINGPQKRKDCYEKKISFEFIEEKLKGL